MANVFEKGEKFAATALELLRKELKVASLFVHKFGIADFRGSEGDTINIKRPPLLRARDKGWRTNNAIVVDSIQQSRIKVSLDAHLYSAVELSPEEETLDEVDYVRDVQAPQVRAVLESIEEAAASSLQGADFVYQVEYNPAAADWTADPRKVAARARKYFQQAHVPTSGRYWLVGANVAEAIATLDKLLDVDTAGLPEAVRDGVVTKLAGFIVIEWDALGENESYFVHETAVALANVAPVVPNGVAKGGGVAAGNGLAVTQMWDYDSDLLKDRSIVHAFSGSAVVTDPQIGDDGRILLNSAGKPVLDFFRAVKVNFGATDTTDGSVWTVQVTGSPTGGTYLLLVDGDPTDPLAYNATNTVIAQALNELDGVSGVKITGTTTKTLTFLEEVVVTKDATGLTGGTTPNVTVTKV